MWDQAEGSGSSFASCIAAMAASPSVADAIREFVSERVWSTITPIDGEDEALVARRRALMSSQLMGLAFARYLLRVPPLSTATPAEIGRWVGPTLERYRPLDVRGPRRGQSRAGAPPRATRRRRELGRHLLAVGLARGRLHDLPGEEAHQLVVAVDETRPLVGVRGHDLVEHRPPARRRSSASKPISWATAAGSPPPRSSSGAEHRLGLGGRELAARLHREQRDERRRRQRAARPRSAPPARWPPGPAPGRPAPRASAAARPASRGRGRRRRGSGPTSASLGAPPSASTRAARRSAGIGPRPARTRSCQAASGARGTRSGSGK